MKLELTKQDTISCRLLKSAVCSREETLEMIVPDTYPDIGQILDTNGVCCLSRRELTDTGAMLSGTIRVFVLYRPEGMDTAERLEAEIPFQHLIESDRSEGNCALQARGDVISAETRMINSRKVLIRADLKESIKIWKPELKAVCCGIRDEPSMGVQQKTEHCQTTLMRMPREKLFTIEEEISLQDGKSEAERILSVRPRAYCAETRLMGSRLVIKGGIQLSVLFKRKNGELSQAEFDLPVSQMLEAEDAGEGTRYQSELQITGWQTGALTEGSLTAVFDLCAQAQFYEMSPVTVLTDAYSTRHPLQLQQVKERFSCLTDSVMRKSVRETVSTDETVRVIYGCHAELGIGEVTEDGGRRKIKVPVQASVLYQTEEGIITSRSKQFAITAQTETESGMELDWSCEIAQLEGLLSAAGIELRLSAEFRLRERKSFEVPVIREAELDEERALHEGGRPSVVLRYAERNEGLWELAKRYGTTCKAICSANQLEEGNAISGQMLLIPRGR